jgi:hypothetical protein
MLPESIDGGGIAPPSIVEPMGYVVTGRHDLPLPTRVKRTAQRLFVDRLLSTY